MKLDRNDIICGFPAKKVRDFLGGKHGAFVHRDHIDPAHCERKAKEYFGEKAIDVLAELSKRGWIIRTKVDADVAADEGMKLNTPIVSLTQEGRQSRIISLNKRFSRTDGDVVVTEVIERAKAINANTDLICGISELRLFGSMLDSNAKTVGDVDIVFELNRRGIAGKEWVARSIARAEATGRSLQYFDQLSYGETEVRLLLKARKPRLSLQPLSSFERLKPLPKSKVIFKAEGAHPAKTKKTK
jgi:hypothetical protein